MRECHGIIQKTAGNPYDDIQCEYLLWLRKEHKLAKESIRIRSSYLNQFLKWYSQFSKNGNLRELKPEIIESFFLKAVDRWGKAYRRSLQATLRSFFDFCYEKWQTPGNLRHSIPAFRTYRLSDVPKKIENSEVVRLLESIDRTSNSGKRTYAIISILNTYGVRGCQLCKLKVSDIDWSAEEIRFPAVKNGRSCSFPLIAEVGNALLDYLRSVERKGQSSEVFLTLRAPYVPLVKRSTLSQIIRTAMNNADIDSPCKGARCFRHGFVSRMLKQGEPFKNIADLLGHKHIETTFIYTKIDFDSLADAALDLPEV